MIRIPFLEPASPAACAGLELVATAVLLIGTDGRITWANPAAENLFELSRKKLVKRRPSQVFGDSSALDAAIAKARAGGASYTEQEIELAAAGKARLHLSCTATPVDLDDADVLVEFRHIDQQLKIAREERLNEQQQANRELIRSLAHEIKNPLGGIRGAAQLLERELDAPTLIEYTQVIIGEADRLCALVDGLLGPARPVRRESANVHELIDRVYRLARAEAPAGVAIERDYDPSLPLLALDRDLLVQAMLNLARNAVQALGATGRLTLRSRALTHATIGTERHRVVASLQFEDDGPGVPPELGETIFYPLVTARAGGTGLGLAVAQDIATRHGGIIEFDSRPGRTVFSLLLPMENGHDEAA